MTEKENAQPHELLAHLKSINMPLSEWIQRAEAFLEKWERVGPVEDNTWQPRKR